jgi:glycerol-1-phosphate dehydrogenase [NAD(P)+]
MEGQGFFKELDIESKRYSVFPMYGSLGGMKEETEEIIVASGALSQLGRVLKRYFRDNSEVLIVADSNTARVVLHSTLDELAKSNYRVIQPLIFSSPPTIGANEDTIGEAATYIKNFPQAVPIAIGSGTLNDIVKTAAFINNRRYISIATASSVDGFTSFGSSVTYKGFKHTQQCKAPIALIADQDILTRAPYRLTSAGWGDLVAKIPSGGDWLLANIVEGEVIDKHIWDLVNENLVEKANNVHLIREKNPQAIGELFLHLAKTGIAMQLTRSSRPASGGEHLISHIWEMDHLCFEGEPLLHGHKVFLGSLITTALYEYLLSLNVIPLSNSFNSKESYSEKIKSLVGETPYRDSLYEVGMKKYRDEKNLSQRQEYLLSVFPVIRERVFPHLLPFSRLKELGVAGGLASHPHQLGIDNSQIKRAVILAQLIRDRYTILDFLAELGLLEMGIDCILSDPCYFG